MHSLVRIENTHDLLRVELPSLIAALVVAEQFYKFHSFTLELLAFLPTWYVIGALISRVTKPRQ